MDATPPSFREGSRGKEPAPNAQLAAADSIRSHIWHGR